MGGSRWPGINLPSNLLTLCGSGTTGCHGWVEGHPEWAKAQGWSVSVYERDHVATIPVWTWRGWVHLRADGTFGLMHGPAPLATTTGVWDTPTTMGDRE